METLSAGKLLYVLERVRARTAQDSVFHTASGGDCDIECKQLEADGLIDDVAPPLDRENGHHMWTAR